MPTTPSRRVGRSALSPVKLLAAVLAGPCLLGGAARAETVWVSALELRNIDQDYGTATADKSVERHPITLAGTKYDHGVGTNASSSIRIDLGGTAKRFTASVGVDDDAAKHKAAVLFRVVGDGKPLWKGKPAEPRRRRPGRRRGPDRRQDAVLLAEPAGDSADFCHADWADARIEYDGTKPRTVAAPVPRRRHPHPARRPRAPHERPAGVRRPARLPFLYKIPATGEQADPLRRRRPARRPRPRPRHRVDHRHASPTRASTRSRSTPATPSGEPPGRSRSSSATPSPSPRRWAGTVGTAAPAPSTDDKSPRRRRRHGQQRPDRPRLDLRQHRRHLGDQTRLQGPPRSGGEPRDADGMINTNKKFPDMKALADYVHGKG